MDDGIRLTDEGFKIVEESTGWKSYSLNKYLKCFCHYNGFSISIDNMSDEEYEKLKEFHDEVSDEVFEGCIVNKQELLSILHRYEYWYIEPILTENEIRQVLNEDTWGGIMALFRYTDSSINDVLVRMNKRNRHPWSEYLELVDSGIITYDELKYLALLADYMSEGKICISPDPPSNEIIGKWLSISGKIYGALTITGTK